MKSSLPHTFNRTRVYFIWNYRKLTNVFFCQGQNGFLFPNQRNSLKFVPDLQISCNIPNGCSHFHYKRSSVFYINTKNSRFLIKITRLTTLNFTKISSRSNDWMKLVVHTLFCVLPIFCSASSFKCSFVNIYFA